MTEPSPKLTRRHFIQLLFTVGSGLAAAELVRALQANNTASIYSDRIKNIIFFIQENHSFDSLFAGFPGANSKFAGQECPDALRRDPPHKHTDGFQPNTRDDRHTALPQGTSLARIVPLHGVSTL